jgi:DNA (cytosine-5)-methyltransferase 3A
MSCGQQALERSGIKVDNYYASEIDKYAIKVTMANYPNTIQLGSVVGVDGYKLPKIDLLMGGSPCQSFSFAGKRKGMATKCETEILTLGHYLDLKSEGYEFEGQSYLFWEFMRLLNECKPKYFLLENVEMGEKWEAVLRHAIGVKALHINSALVSAQNRKRIYFTNIGMQASGLFGDLESIIKQPKDKKILLKEVLESEVDEKYFLSQKMLKWLDKHAEKRDVEVKKLDGNDKSGCLTSSAQVKQNLTTDYIIHNTMPRSGDAKKDGNGHLSRNDDITYCLEAANTNAIEIIGLTEVRTEEAKKIRRETGTNPKKAKELVERTDGKIGALLTSQTPDNLVREIKQINPITNGKQTYQQDRIYDIYGINPALNTHNNGYINTSRIRRLTPTECERLQTVADNYTNHVSDSQRYKMLGNGWTVDVIAHIFSYL